MKRSTGKCWGLVAWFVAVFMVCVVLPTAALAEAVVELSEATETVVLTAQDEVSEAAPVVKTDTLTRDLTGATDVYIEWDYRSSNTGAVYAGNSCGNYGSIQLRSDKRDSGIVVTSSGGKALSVAVDWNANTASGRTLNVYGKDTAYASPTDLYDAEKQGTLIGTITYGTNTVLTISDDYAYIGVRSNGGALYMASLTVTWADSATTAPTYGVGVNQIMYGSVVASHTAARAGDQVTLTANPEVGYTLDTLSVTDAEGNDIPVTNNTFTMPAASVTINATFKRLPTVSYIDERGDLQDTGDIIYHILTQREATAAGGHVLESGWWVVSEAVKPSARLVINGDVHLILKDGARLEDTNGISVPEGKSLTIYGQEQGTGELIAAGSLGAAGIGGKAGEAVGTITINGGTITATGGVGTTGVSRDSAGGAGIGGGNNRSGGTITINGGTVTATGKACAAGIGGGSSGAGGSIAITGGTINATGGGYGDPPNTDVAGGAGIGGGTSAGGGTVTISGGKITAQGAAEAAGMGPGGGFSANDDSSCGAIALSLFRSTDFVQANTFVNSHGKHAIVAIAYPDGTEASVKDADDETKQYKGSLTAEEIAAIAGRKLVASTAAQPTLKVASLTLSGTIGVNYFMDLNSLSENELAGCRMEFSVGDGAKRTTHVANLDAGFRDSGGEGYYGFSCPTTSIQMADTIRATFFWGDESMELPDYSVRAYVVNFDAYQASHPGAFDEKTVALVHAIADYGHFAQPYLAAENGWTIGSDYAKMDTSYMASYESELASVRSALAAYAASKSILGTPVASATMRLHLDSGTSVEALLSPVEDATFSAADVAEVAGSFSGREVSVTLRPDGRVSVRVDCVSAHLLAKPLVVSYSGQEVLRLSALSFANSTLAGSPDDVTRDAMCALYKYYEAAAAYKP